MVERRSQSWLDKSPFLSKYERTVSALPRAPIDQGMQEHIKQTLDGVKRCISWFTGVTMTAAMLLLVVPYGWMAAVPIGFAFGLAVLLFYNDIISLIVRGLIELLPARPAVPEEDLENPKA